MLFYSRPLFFKWSRAIEQVTIEGSIMSPLYIIFLRRGMST